MTPGVLIRLWVSFFAVTATLGCKTAQDSGAKSHELLTQKPTQQRAVLGDSCKADPDKVFADLLETRGYLGDGSVRELLEVHADDLGDMCRHPKSTLAWADDPVCGAYCDYCEKVGLPAQAVNLFRYFGNAANATEFFIERLGDYKAVRTFSLNASFIFAALDKKYGIENGIQNSFCFANFYDLAVLMKGMENTEFGRPTYEVAARALCHLNAALNSCAAIPAIGPAVKAMKEAVLAIPPLRLSKTLLSVTCGPGTYVADTILRCRAFKNGCLIARKAAQPLDNTACCTCGIKHQGTGKLGQYWGAQVYAGQDECENLPDARIRAQFPQIPAGGETVCEKTLVDRQKTRACRFERIVYGSSVSCGLDRNVYCVQSPIVTVGGRTLNAVKVANGAVCDKIVTQDEFQSLLESYSKAQEIKSVVVDFSKEAAAVPEEK